MAKTYTQLFLEAFIAGIVLVVLGYIIGYLTKPLYGVTLPEICNQWNKYYIMEINLFLIGFVAHLTFEISGANHWYCKNGYACSN